MLALQRNRQALRMVSITPPSPLVINAARARFVVIVSNLNVPIAENPELPVASPTRANGSTIRRSCKPSLISFASLTVLGHVRTSRLILHRVNNVDVLGKRMDKFEAAIVKCVNAVEQHISITNTSLQSTKARLPDEDSDVLETMEPWSAHVNGDESPIANSEDWVPPLEQKNRHLVKESGGDERFFGSGSMYSIWVEIISTTKDLLARSSPETQNLQNPKKSLENAVVASLDPNLISALERACEHLQSYSAEPALEGCSDRTPLSLPPRFLLETILDPFLKELNPILPIFARSSLLEAIKVQYDPRQQQQLDPAWAICFNNLILRILTTKASRSVESPARNTMDDRLRTHLLLNAQRCYSDLGGLLKPRIVNVQALLSMVGPRHLDFCHCRLGTLWFS